jgi:hypothetical protein
MGQQPQQQHVDTTCGSLLRELQVRPLSIVSELCCRYCFLGFVTWNRPKKNTCTMPIEWLSYRCKVHWNSFHTDANDMRIAFVLMQRTWFSGEIMNAEHMG